MNRSIFALLLISAPLTALAHGGGLDANGCHADRATGARHCHDRVDRRLVTDLDLSHEDCPHGDPGGRDLNCSHFRDWEHAQGCFQALYPAFGDVHRLDANNDLLACEFLGVAPGVVSPLIYENRDRDCADFDTQPQAQAFYDGLSGARRDDHRLDTNGDGVVCEGLPTVSDAPAET